MWKYFLLESPADDESDDEPESDMSEVRFIPEDRGLLDAMFHAMSVCQTLHPDPNDSVSDGIVFLTSFKHNSFLLIFL